VPKERIEDIPAEEADPDDRTAAQIPEEMAEPVEPPGEAQDVSEEQVRRLSGPGHRRDEPADEPTPDAA
jgi:hypothetical protein